MRRFQLLLLAIPLFILSQCKKDDEGPQLPPETTTGANKVGCKIDGKVLIPRSRWTTLGFMFRIINRGENSPSNFGFSIVDAQVNPSPLLLMEMDSVVLREGQTYPFKTTKGNPQVKYYSGNNEYIKRDQDDGEITITRLDSTKNIISGRFNFVGTDKSTGQQIQVTEGRFDFSHQ